MASEKEAKRIIAIAVDNSKYADYAFDWYMETIKNDGDSIVLIHVPEYLDLHLASPGVVEQLLKEVQEKTKTLEEKYREKVCNKGVPAKFRTGGGSKPGQVIVQIADEEKASLIITGTRGLGAMKRVILGSVSDYIIHHAHVPVLVCRKPGED